MIALIVAVSAMSIFTACTAEPKIDHIEIFSSPKTSYVLGEELDLTNASIIVVYVDNSERKVDITQDMVSSYSPDLLGDQYIVVSYEGVAATFKVTVSRPTVTAVSLQIPDANVNYIVEQQLNLDSCFMVIEFSDNTNVTVPITADMCSGYDREKLGLQEITVSYDLDGTVYQSTFNVTVEDRELIGIDMHTVPSQTVYYLGDDTLDLIGGVLLLKYNNGYTHTVQMTSADGTLLEGLTYSFDSTAVVNSTFASVYYGGFETQFNVKIANRDVTEYTLINYEKEFTDADYQKFNYRKQYLYKEQYQNVNLYLDGLMFLVTYSNGSSETLTVSGGYDLSEDESESTSAIRFSGYDKTKAGEQTLTIEFYYNTVKLSNTGTLTVNVIEREANGIKVTEEVAIYQDTVFDISNWKVALTYNNGETGTPFQLTNAYVDWTGNLPVDCYSEVGEQSWFIKYNEDISCEYKFNVVELRVNAIKFVYSGEIIASVNGKADTSGVTIKVTYNSGMVREKVAVDPDKLAFANKEVGSATSTYTYVDEYETKGFKVPGPNITVVRKIDRVVARGDYKSSYIINQSFETFSRDKTTNAVINELILDVYYAGEVNAESVHASSEEFQKWTLTSNAENKSLTFTEVGTYTINISTPGFDGECKITVTVTNNFKEIVGLYSVDEDDMYTEAASFGSVVEGCDIDLSKYRLLVSFEGGEEYIELSSNMIDYNKYNTALGERKVNVYYPDDTNADASIEMSVIVEVKSSVGIEIKKQPDKKTYVAKDSGGLTFDYTGMVLWLVYDNGTYSQVDIEKQLTEGRLVFTGLDSETGEHEITVTYSPADGNVFVTTLTITVVPSSLNSVAWKDDMPEARVSVGTQFDILNFAITRSGSGYERLGNIRITVREANGNSYESRISEYADGFTVFDYEPNNSGRQYVKLFYGSREEYNSLSVTERETRTLTVCVDVIERALDKIELRSNTANAFVIIQGAEINVSDYMLLLTFTDGSTALVPLKPEHINVSEANPDGYDSGDTATSDARPVTVSYTYGSEKTAVTATVNFKVIEKSLVKIDINDLPKLFYLEHEEFDVSGGTIMLYYDNGTTELKRLSDAVIGDSSGSFNIDRSRFNNEEFSGQTKDQRITVHYTYYGTQFETSYLIYMRDRKDAEVKYDENNSYTFVYGDVTAPSITVIGYNSYEADDRSKTLESTEYSIEYIPQSTWLTVRRETGVDYTVFPKDAGEYRIVVSYVGDGVHNAFEDATNTLVINKKKIYIGFAKQTKVYGQVVPGILMTIGTKSGEALQDPLSLLVDGDSFYSESFNYDYTKRYATVANVIDANGNVLSNSGSPILLDMFDIAYFDGNDEISMTEATHAGNYNIGVKNSLTGKNYEIIVTREAFNITKRPVMITPTELTYVYGIETIPAIRFTVSAVSGQVESGLYGSDTLQGALARSDRNNNAVGQYNIEMGSLELYNPDYDIKLPSEESRAKVNIVKRTVYVKVDTLPKVYGEQTPEPPVRYYGDSACTDTFGAFAQGDDASSLGVLSYVNLPDRFADAGSHEVNVSIDSTGFAKAVNYNIVYISGYINIAKRPISVVADAASKVYGDDDPELTYNVYAIEGNAESGLVKKDGVTEDVLEGTLSRVAGENYGEHYNILIGTLNNNNYSIAFTSAKFAIVRKALYVRLSADDLSKVYDGKKPSISGYELLEKIDTDYVEYTKTDAKKFISFSFEGSSKDAGTYGVRVAVSNNNYSVAFAGDVVYNYVITKRVVRITAAEFRGLPDGLEYNGSDYEFSAHIGANDLQHVYNDDGTFATDDNNKPIFDDDSVTLTLSSVKKAGTYTTRATDITDKNYALDVEGSPAITFTLKPRTVYIEIKCNSETEDYTIERAFNNQSASLSSQDYIVENTIPGEGTPYFALGVYSGDNLVTAKDVRYENNVVVGYDIRIAENSNDPNYVVALKQAYRFKIVPRKVQLLINERYLTKVYDGEAPTITSTMFSPAVATTGFDNSTVSFTFERSGNDGRDNTTVGTYDVNITCSDKNFDVSTRINYIYTIERASINITISSSALTKAYDGNDFEIPYSKLTLSSYYGTAPIVHNFSYGDDDENAFEEFKAKLEALTNAYSSLKAAMDAVTFAEGVNNARSKLEEVLSRLNNDFGALVKNNNANCFTTDNAQTALTAVNSMVDNLNSAITSINNGEADKAAVRFRNVTTAFGTIKTIVESENSYIAFVFGSTGDTETKAKGTYPITMYYADYNREYKLLNTSPTAEIKEHRLKITLDSVTVPYGTERDGVNINYHIWDTSNNTDVSEDDLISSMVKGSPKIVSDLAVLVAGTYAIDLSEMYVDNSNYVLDKSAVARVTVGKATLTIVMDDILDESVFVYGNKISQNDLYSYIGSFTYLDIDSINEATTDPKQLAYIEMAEEYAEANNLSNLGFRDKLKACFGGLAGGDSVDNLGSLLGGVSLVCHCYVDENGIVEIFNAGNFAAGNYEWFVAGYTAQNYIIKVIPGTLTVSKAKIYASTGLSSVLSKSYGDNRVKFNYGSIAADNLFVYANTDTNKESGISLSDMVWGHSYQGEIDPMNVETDAGDTVYTVSFNSDGYYMDNYTVVFDSDYSVQVVPAELILQVKSTTAGKSSVIAKYMATPDAYTYVYTGFKNGDTAESLGLAKDGDYAPTIMFKEGNTYREVGKWTMYASSVDVSVAAQNVTNYSITAKDFVYEVEARKIYVWLEGVDTVLSTMTGNSITIAPYTMQITQATETSRNSGVYIPEKGEIVGGNYGKANFRFEAEMTDAERNDTELAAAIEAYAQNAMAKIKLYASAVIKEDADKKGLDLVYYKGEELYVHNVNSVSRYATDSEGGYVNAKLSGMSFGATEYNVALDYREFRVSVQPEVRWMTAAWDGKLFSSDLTDMEAFKSKLEIAINDITGDAIKNGASEYITLVGLDSVGLGYTTDVTVYYDRQFNLFSLMTGLNYSITYTVNDSQQTQNVTVTDARTNVYDTSKVANLIKVVPTRIYSNTSAVATDPAIGGLVYGNVTAATGSNYISTSSAYAFDGIRMQVRLGETTNNAKSTFTVVLAGNATPGNGNTSYILTMTFDMYNGANAVITLYKVNGSTFTELSTTNYAINCSMLFDGYSHDLRVKIDKELLQMIVAIDGTAGSLTDISAMAEMASAKSYFIGANAKDGNKFYVSSTVAFVIDSLTLSEQGLYESTGVFINLRSQSAGKLMLKTDNLTFQVNSGLLNNFFGLPSNLASKFTTSYYIDGVKVDDGTTSVNLKRGTHMVELALYCDGVLIDSDYTIVTVARNNSTTILDVDQNAESSITGGSKIYTYTPATNVSVSGDPNLVASDVSERSFVIVPTGYNKNNDIAPQYYEHSFALERVASLNAAGNPYYAAGTATIYYNLFVTPLYWATDRKITDANTNYGTNGIAVARLRFVRTQEQENYANHNNNYKYAVYLDVSDGSELVTTELYTDLSGGATGVGFDLRLYNGKLGAVGSGAKILRIRLAGSSDWQTVDLNKMADISDTIPFIKLTGSATRISNRNVTFIESVSAYDNYLVDGAYTMYDAAGVTVADGSTLTVSDGAGASKYSSYDTLNFEFGVTTASGTIKMALSESVVGEDGSGLYGTYLDYDLSANKLVFRFRLDGVYSLAQEYALDDLGVDAVGRHTISVDLNFAGMSSKVYVGGDATEYNLTRDGVILTDSGGAQLHYHTVTVIIDGKEAEFYMPRYNDMNGWLKADGSTYGSGSSNKYQIVGDSAYPPTFIPLYNFNSVSTDGTSITVYRYVAAIGETGAYAERALTASTPI